jgi:hypothetical protein
MTSWRCSRCGASNDATGVTCSQCGFSRGSVVLPGASATESPAEASPTEVPSWAGDPYEWHLQLPPALKGDSVDDPAPAPASSAFWRRIPLGLVLILGAIVVGVATSWYVTADRSKSGEITKSGDLAATELRVGDCFDLKDPEADSFEQVTARRCTDEHEYETFHVAPMPRESQQGEAAFEALVADICETAFLAYVGTAHESSRFEMSWLEPTFGILADDPSIQCILRDPQTPRRTTSAMGSKQ